MIPDRDVWAAALAIVKRYGDDAMLEASERADQLLDEGDMAGAETWHRILNAIERLQAKVPAEGEKVH
jgi:triphosphoribosyl-dephospho-CoA synthetase